MTSTHRGEDMIDVMVSLMRHKRSTTYIVALAAEIIAGDARLSQYVANSKARPRDNADEMAAKLLEILTFFEEIMNDCISVRHELEGGLDPEKVRDMLREIKERLEHRLNILNDE